jgi:hypothetical protein
MKHLRVIGACVLSAGAIGAVAATNASAIAPEFGRCLKVTPKALSNYDSAKCLKLANEDTGTEAEKLAKGNYQWFPGVVKNKFTTAIKEGTIATLETISGTKVTCTGEKSIGEFTGLKTVGNMTVHFTGCETNKVKCESAGAGIGNITTAALEGVIGFETEVTPPSKDHVANELHAPGGGHLADFECVGLTVEVRGSVLHKIAANSMKLTAIEKFTASKGHQKPEHFAGGTAKEHILETSFNHGAFEQSGQTITGILTGEEKVEVNTVV